MSEDSRTRLAVRSIHGRAYDAHNAWPRKYRSQKVPGQKTDTAVIRISQRDLCDLNSRETVGTIVRLIRPILPPARPLRKKQKQSFSLASLATIGAVHFAGNEIALTSRSNQS